MTEVFICDYTRTPIGRFGGALSSVRTDDLGAIRFAKLNANLNLTAADFVIV